jgi:hypothetical protein
MDADIQTSERALANELEHVCRRELSQAVTCAPAASRSKVIPGHDNIRRTRLVRIRQHSCSEVTHPGGHKAVGAGLVGRDTNAVATPDRVQLLHDRASDEASRQKPGGVVKRHILRDADQVTFAGNLRKSRTRAWNAKRDSVAGGEANSLFANRIDGSDGLNAQWAEPNGSKSEANLPVAGARHQLALPAKRQGALRGGWAYGFNCHGLAVRCVCIGLLHCIRNNSTFGGAIPNNSLPNL